MSTLVIILIFIVILCLIALCATRGLVVNHTVNVVVDKAEAVIKPTIKLNGAASPAYKEFPNAR